MNANPLRWLALAATLLVACATDLSAAEPAPEDAAMVAKLMTAIEKADYDSFVADGEPNFRQLKREQFDAVTANLGPKLQEAHELTYLGELRQRGYHVTLWKVSFKDGTDDALASLSMRDGKVGGFFIR